MKKYNLILASGSPRRRELLGWLDIPFIIMPSGVEEKSSLRDPTELVQELARQKGSDIFDQLMSQQSKEGASLPMVISSDTLVCLGKKVFGKPRDRQQAKEMLTELSGKVHKVLTGVCLHYVAQNGETKVVGFVGESEVEFQVIIPELLETYLDTDDSLDKAGAYGIQGQALTFIKGLRGSYSNVMGFPLSEFSIKLKNICEVEGFTSWKDAFVVTS